MEKLIVSFALFALCTYVILSVILPVLTAMFGGLALAFGG